MQGGYQTLHRRFVLGVELGALLRGRKGHSASAVTQPCEHGAHIRNVPWVPQTCKLAVYSGNSGTMSGDTDSVETLVNELYVHIDVTP